MSGVKIFSLEGQSLKLTTAEDMEPHLQALRDNDAVEQIRLLGNTLGIGASEALAKVLQSKQTLQVANLADIFTTRLLSEIPPALSHLLNALLALPNLHTIDLSDNAFGLNTVAPLVDFLSQHTPLRHLYLNNNGLGPAAGVLVADALTALAAKKEAARKAGNNVPDLELVICGRNRLEDGSMAAWAKAYAANTGVKTIKMTQNGIRQQGISHLITNGIAHLSQLDTLDLQDNTFTALGANALSRAVGNWAELRELGVGDCLLGGRGAVGLAAALAKGHNKKIEVLRLQFNDINAKGLAGLSSASSASLPLLRRVELNGNKFDQEDPSIDELRTVLEGRKEDAAGHEHDDDDEYWGLDDLDELESEDEDEDESDGEEQAGSDDEGVEVEEHAAKLLVQDTKAEESNVPQDKDGKVDDLADLLKKTDIK